MGVVTDAKGFPAAPHSPLRRELLGLLTCPDDGGALSGWDGAAEDGALECESCGKAFPVRRGVPCLLPSEMAGESAAQEHEFAEKQREMAARDAQVGDYDAMLGLRLFTAAELPLTLRYLRPESDSLMLEGGCGTGRMTAAFAGAARGLVCVDFSAESLQVAKKKLPPPLQEKTLFAQADLSRLPLKSAAFDRVGSFGVYEHIPTEEARARALAHLARALKPRTHGGRFALSAYRWGPPQSWLSEKEGHHDGGIYFYRFTMKELIAQAAPHFDVDGATETLLYYHLIRGRRRHGDA